MEKKETYKAPEMRSVVLIKEGVMQSASQLDGSWNKSIKEGTTWDTSDTDYGME
ncbi:MAG: hypothetical protein IKH00_02775 [Bacteroidales bacterium]|nr:hypothetical protein [Bacteroidales bacterium]